MSDNLNGKTLSVAIVVPNYNHAAYLKQSLGSIEAQTCPPDQVLIIDDASTDNSMAVISDFSARHPSWQVIKHKSRLGVLAAANEAVRQLETDWISYLGADDFLSSTYIEKAMACAREMPTPNMVCGCLEVIGNVRARSLRPILLPSVKPRYISPEEFRQLLRIGDNYFNGTVILYRRQAVLDAGGFDKTLGSLSDSILSRQLAIRGGFYFIPEILGYWRLLGTNYSTMTVTRSAQIEPLLTKMQQAISNEKDGIFPKGYEMTLDRRIRFGGARLLILDSRLTPTDRASQIADLLRLPQRERSILAVLMSAGYPGSLAALTWLTVRMRPMSLKALIGQWWARRAILAAAQRDRV